MSVPSLERPPPDASVGPGRPAPSALFAGPGPLWDRLAVVGWIAFAASIALQAWGILTASHALLVNRAPDDAYYYLEIARRLGRGEGFTFDGINGTNGFHLIWQLVLGPPARFISDDDVLVKVALLLGLAAVAVGCVLLVRVAARIVPTAVALLAVLVTIHSRVGFESWVNAMEGSMVVLAVAVVTMTLVRWCEEPTTRRAVLVGVACAALVLARFDMAAVVILVGIAMCARTRSLAPARGWLLGLLGVMVPFALWWLWLWGPHILTTSATIKHHALSEHFATDGGRLGPTARQAYLDRAVETTSSILEGASTSAISVLGSLPFIVTLVLAGIGLWHLRTKIGTRLPPAAWSLVVIVGLVTIKGVVDIIDATLWSSSWYLAAQTFVLVFALVLVAAIGAAVVAQRSKPLGVVAVAVLLTLVIPYNAVFVLTGEQPRRGSWPDAVDEAADWILANGPEGRYGAWDAGLLGYRLDGVHDVVNLDGLVNDYDFAELVNSGASRVDLVRASGVDIVVNRLNATDRAQLPCGRELWRSTIESQYGDASDPESFAPVYVLDVSACR